MKNKVYFITPNLANGGAEHVTAIIANGLFRDGFVVSIVKMKDDKMVYPVDRGINQISLFGRGNRFKRICKKIWLLRKIMKENAKATYVAMVPFETFYTFIAGLGLHVRIIYSLRNSPMNMNSLMDWVVKKIIYPRSDGIIFQTEEAINYFSEEILKKGIVIENPISDNLPKPYNGIREKEFVAVGRLTEQKNYPLLLEAFGRVHNKYPDWKLEIYGQGHLEIRLKELCCQLQIEDTVSFYGFVDDVIYRINKSAAFVSSSDYEGISNAMLEALCTGLPCICTDCPVGGARKYIQNGVNGFLIPVGDVVAMEQAMLRIIERPEEIKCLTQKTNDIIERLSINNIIKKWEKVL